MEKVDGHSLLAFSRGTSVALLLRKNCPAGPPEGCRGAQIFLRYQYLRDIGFFEIPVSEPRYATALGAPLPPGLFARRITHVPGARSPCSAHAVSNPFPSTSNFHCLVSKTALLLLVQRLFFLLIPLMKRNELLLLL